MERGCWDNYATSWNLNSDYIFVILLSYVTPLIILSLPYQDNFDYTVGVVHLLPLYT